jgi:glycerophosphoryl diester phosphodiesterase
MAWILGCLGFLMALYLYLIAPNMRGKDVSGLLGVKYAHRGLYDNENGVPENSIPAFQKAIEAGHGIELDVQLTRDGQLAVFHDGDLKRMCGADARLCDLSYEEISRYTLLQTKERIPLFDEVLELVDGRVPLIVEIKHFAGVDITSRKAYEALSRYNGPCCVESFHPLAMRWFKKNAPQVIRGQLASGSLDGPFWQRIGLRYLLINALSRPDFIAYDLGSDKNLSMIFMRKVFRPLLVAWTVRTSAEQARAAAMYDLQIFEGRAPER